MLIDNVPQALKNQLLWGGTILKANGEIDKAPRDAGLNLLDTTRPDRWMSFEQARQLLAEGVFVRIGCCLVQEAGITCVDIDAIKNDITHDSPQFELNRQFQLGLFNGIATYKERSQSGSGAHIFVFSPIKVSRKATDWCEIYSHSRFIVCTGDTLDPSPLAQGEQYVADILARLPASSVTDEDKECGPAVELTTDQLVDLVRHHYWFSHMPSTDWSASEMSLCNEIARHTQNYDQIMDVYLRSAMAKDFAGYRHDGQRTTAAMERRVFKYTIPKAVGRVRTGGGPRDSKGRFTAEKGGLVTVDEKPQERVSPEVASERIREAILGWVDTAERWYLTDQTEPPPSLAIKCTPGIGKSKIVREVLEDVRTPWAYYALTRRLALAAKEESGLPATVVLGRSEMTCVRYEEAEALGVLGYRVGAHVCAKYKPGGGQPILCPHHGKCSYIEAIRDAWGPGNPGVIATAPMLFRPPKSREDGGWLDKLVIVDELMPLVQIHRDLAATGYPDMLDSAIDVQRDLVPVDPPESYIRPDMSDDALRKAIENLKPPEVDQRVQSAYARVMLRRVLFKNELPDLRHTVFVKDGKADLWLKETLPHRPILIVDADVEAPILKEFLPQCEIVDIKVKQNLLVTQIRNETIGATKLTSDTDDTYYRNIPRITRRAVMKKGSFKDPFSVLAIVQKAVVLRLFTEFDPAFAAIPQKDREAYTLDNKLFGANWLWFGPKVKGNNRYKDVDRVVCFSQLELNPEGHRDIVRATFGHTSPGKRQPAIVPYEGTGTGREVFVHEREGDNAIARLHRDSMTIQAIERCRSIWRQEPVPVWIVDNRPIEGLTGTENKLEDYEDLVGTRIEAALIEAMFRGQSWIRLQHDLIGIDAPQEFPGTSEQHRKWLEDNLSEQLIKVAALNEGRGSVQLYRIREPGQRGRFGTLVLSAVDPSAFPPQWSVQPEAWPQSNGQSV